MINKRNLKHGLKGTRIEGIWQGIKQRCFNPNNEAYESYGGRGILMCERWRNNLAYFLEDMGHPPSGMTIERINNECGYEPDNCRWATRKEQQNNRRVNRFIDFNGKRQTAMAWANELGIAHQTIYNRMDLGWSAEFVLKLEKQTDKTGLRLGGHANGERNKQKTHCVNGHEFTPDNTRPNGKNGRGCRRCHANREAARRLKK